MDAALKTLNSQERRDAAFHAAACSALPSKPLYTKPCNGCGLCCMSQLCPIGEMMFPGVEAPCPALVFEPGQARCGVVMAEAAAGMEPLAAQSLGIGCGCSMPESYITDEEIDAFDRRAREMVFGQNGGAEEAGGGTK